MKKNEMSIGQTIRDEMTEREQQFAGMRTALEADRKYLALGIPSKLTFRVHLSSHWADEGEESVTIEGKDPLEKMIPAAIQQFKEINRRGNVAADWYVDVILPSGHSVSLPEKLWEHLKVEPVLATKKQKAKYVAHHDDSPCDGRLESDGYCHACQFYPDMQSKILWPYCPTCDVPLDKMRCPTCQKEYDIP